MIAIAQETAYEIKEIPIHQIQTDGTQSRAAMNQDTIDEYAELITQNVEFEPLVVFSDGTTYWLADGHHRLAAAKQAGCNDRWCKIYKGTKLDALLYSLQANVKHGLRRTTADKRHSVRLVLEIPEFQNLSNNQIAEMCCVSSPTVASVRAELAAAASSGTDSGVKVLHLEPAKRIGKDGKSYPTGLKPKKPKQAESDDEPANANQAELSELPGDCTDFDTAAMDDEQQDRAAKSVKSGAEIYPAKLLKETIDHFGKGGRLIDKLDDSCANPKLPKLAKVLDEALCTIHDVLESLCDDPEEHRKIYSDESDEPNGDDAVVEDDTDHNAITEDDDVPVGDFPF